MAKNWPPGSGAGVKLATLTFAVHHHQLLRHVVISRVGQAIHADLERAAGDGNLVIPVRVRRGLRHRAQAGRDDLDVIHEIIVGVEAV